MNTIKSIIAALLLTVVVHIDRAEASFISNLVTKLPTPPAQAAIPGLYNTGVANVGGVDPHYALTVSADPSSTAYVASSMPSSWMSNGPGSQWIAPSANQTSSGAGNYMYRTTFDLSGFNPSTASISGLWAADDKGLDIKINGVSTGQSTNTTFNPFAINSGFVSGLNTLDFLVLNDPNNHGLNPSGLRVEFLSATARIGTSVPASVVPIPAAVWLFGSGLVGLLGFAQRKHGIKQA